MELVFKEFDRVLHILKVVCQTEDISIQFNYGLDHEIVDYKTNEILRLGNKDCRFKDVREFMLLKEYIDGYYAAYTLKK